MADGLAFSGKLFDISPNELAGIFLGGCLNLPGPGCMQIVDHEFVRMLVETMLIKVRMISWQIGMGHGRD